MPGRLEKIAALARTFAGSPTVGAAPQLPVEATPLHPFETRNIHDELPVKVRKLFDDGHYAEATFSAFKYLESHVRQHSKLNSSGVKLMMDAFDEQKPKLRLTALGTDSEKDEQRGYRFLFAGGVQAIRNPRAHEYTLSDDPDTCLDHLSFISMLLRRLESANFK